MLICAAYGGHLEIVKYLIETHGFDPNAKAKDGSTPAFWAKYQNHKDVVDYLQAQGAISDESVDKGWNDLTATVRNGDIEGLRDLLAKDSSVNYTTGHKLTLLMIACQYGHDDLAALLIEHGADLVAKDCEGKTALH